jgi:hypothetical protein
LGNLGVRVFLSISVAFYASAAACAWPFDAPQPRHPAVVRVVVPEGRSTSLGSGALVAVNDQYGLVVTNWHVVRDGSGTATVIFPDGFRSAATVVRADRDWDLAALVIWRPRVGPIPLAADRPQIGEPLWIAGYGRDSYRMAGGQCTHYLSPGGGLPYDMIELSTGARQGDSGGPILNQRGELAGVLFGAAWGRTSGSHCLRVKQFLDPALDRFDSLGADDAARIARRDPMVSPPGGSSRDVAVPAATIPFGPSTLEPRKPTTTPNTEPAAQSGGLWTPQDNAGWAAASPRVAPSVSTAQHAPARTNDRPQRATAPSGAWEQGKTLLAVIGVLAICFHVLRRLGA